MKVSLQIRNELRKLSIPLTRPFELVFVQNKNYTTLRQPICDAQIESLKFESDPVRMYIRLSPIAGDGFSTWLNNKGE